MGNEKSIYFANFNITFGANEEPMLEHFIDIIYPAFCSGYKRGKGKDSPKFYFDDICIKEHNNELIMVGNYIKDTEYKVQTSVIDGKLISTPGNYPTAPYSRFIIFLKNHRMVLVKNESNSPDVISFQATVRKIVKDYTLKTNRKIEDKDKKLPNALINIVDVPLPKDIEKTLNEVKKIKYLKLRFFPLNGDIDTNPLSQDIDSEIKKMGSKSACVQFTSPQSKDYVRKLVENSAGMSVATLEVQDKNGEIRRIKDGNFNSNTNIQLQGNINEENDAYIIQKAKENEAINIISSTNQSLYEKFKTVIRELIN